MNGCIGQDAFLCSCPVSLRSVLHGQATLLMIANDYIKVYNDFIMQMQHRYCVSFYRKLPIYACNVVIEQVVSMTIKQQPSRQLSLKPYQFGKDHPARANQLCYFISYM